VSPVGDLAAHLGGLVAAEGTFVHCCDHFAFAVGLGATDATSCETLADWFGIGRLQRSPRRKPHYDDEVTFRVDRLSDLVDVIVPFMDEHLPASYKRQQFEEWRAELLDYWEHKAKRRRSCTVEGCGSLQRARGLCRHHYYATYGG
jgi:hypothetical protein